VPLGDYAIEYVSILAGFYGFLAEFLGKFLVVTVDAALLKLKERTDSLLEKFGGVKIHP